MFAANIGAIVGIQVLNKTSEEYWFLVKFNLSLLNGNMDLRNIKKEKAYFLIRLQIDLRLETRRISNSVPAQRRLQGPFPWLCRCGGKRATSKAREKDPGDDVG